MNNLEFIGQSMADLEDEDFMLIHTVADGGKWELYYAPSPTEKVMPISVGGHGTLGTVLAKALEVIDNVHRNEYISKLANKVLGATQ